MKKYLKKIGMVTLASVMMLTFVFRDNSLVRASEFAGNESYWTSVCQQYITDPNLLAKCQDYQAYLKELSEQKRNEANNAQSQIDEMQGDIQRLSALSAQYAIDLANANAEVASSKAAITEMENSIAEVEVQIEQQTAKIEERKLVVKDRMIKIQASMNTNQYVNFLMGSSDFMEFVQRSKSMGVLTDLDKERIEQLNIEMQKLDADKAELARIMELQKEQLAYLEVKQAEAANLEAEGRKVYNAVLTQSQNLAGARDAATDEAGNLDETADGLMPSPPTPPTGGGGSGSTAGANWYSGYYDSRYNVFSPAYTGQCTWYVFGRANEMNGNAYRGLPTGNAQTWLYTAASRGFSTGSQPRSNSIIVWGFGYYGHVAYVESYSNGMLRLSEGNIDAPGGGLPMYTSLETAILYTRDTTATYQQWINQRGAPLGFIYL